MGPGRRGVAPNQQGTVVLVPFPFTDLSGRKRRPALVVSPDDFGGDDLILCAVTSQVPASLSRWEVRLDSVDLMERALPKPSIIRVGKLFTMHRSLIVGSFGTVRDHKLTEVLDTLQALFARSNR